MAHGVYMGVHCRRSWVTQGYIPPMHLKFGSHLLYGVFNVTLFYTSGSVLVQGDIITYM